MKPRKYLVYSSIGLLLFFLVGCVMITKNYTKNTPYNIIYVPKQIDESNNFWTALIEGAKMAANEYEVNLEIVAGKSEEDIEGQNRLIEYAISKKPDAILVSPCSYTDSTHLLKKVKEQGIRLVLIDSVVDEPVEDITVATDNIKAGNQLGNYAESLLTKETNLAVIGHVKGASTAMEREAGLRKSLGSNEKAIKEVVFCGSLYGRANDLAVEMIEKYPDLNMLVGLNEYSAVGAARAIRNLNLQNQIKLVGFDSSVEAIQLMEEGIFSGFVIQQPFNMGYLGVEQAVKLLNGEPVEHFLDSGSKIITIDNLYTEENQKLLFPFVGNQSKNQPKP